MNILDLKKGDKVYGGLTRSGNGFATHVGYQEIFEVRSVILRNGDLITNGKSADFNTRLKTEGNDVIYACELHNASIYASEEDFLDGNAIQSFNIPVADVSEMLASACGLKVCKEGFPELWEWDTVKKEAKPKWWVKGFNLADPQLPEGSYPTKEACEKANRKMVTIEVTKTYLTEREEGEEAEWLLNHPDEYEWSDDDECISDAKYSD